MMSELKLNGQMAVIEENSLFRDLCGNFSLWSLDTSIPAFSKIECEASYVQAVAGTHSLCTLKFEKDVAAKLS